MCRLALTARKPSTQIATVGLSFLLDAIVQGQSLCMLLPFVSRAWFMSVATNFGSAG